MQELIEHIQVNATKFSLMNTYNILKEIEPYLEKEKEQIIDAYRSGHSDRSFEKYNPYFYEETYNQKQITYERIN